MALFATVKEFETAKAEITELKTQLTESLAAVKTLEEKLAASGTEISTLKATAATSAASIASLTSDLAAEKTAHAATKASVETEAAAKAQTILAAAGHPPVPAGKPQNAAAGTELDGVLAQLATEKDPVKKGILATKALALRNK